MAKMRCAALGNSRTCLGQSRQGKYD